MKSYNRILIILTCAWMMLFLVSCSQSNEPNPATPEGRFELAKQEFTAARYEKALNYTSKILRDTPNHELAYSAAIMEMTIYGGLAEGCFKASKAFSEGMMMTRDLRIRNDFRSKAFDYYRREKDYLTGFAEGFDRFSGKMDKDKAISFKGAYPGIEAGPRIALEKVRKGLVIPEEDRLKDEEEELRDGVVYMTTALAGVGEDRAKAKTLYAAGLISVQPGDFLFAVAKFLHTQDAMFDRTALNDVKNFRSFCERTNKTITESIDLLKAQGDKKKLDEAMKLKKECEATMKRIGKA